MIQTLLVSITSGCRGSCAGCTLKSSPENAVLDPSLVEKVVSIIDRVNETVVLCPGSPSKELGTILNSVVDIVSKVSGKIALFLSIEDLKEGLINYSQLLGKVNELVLVSYDERILAEQKQLLKMMLSRGLDRVKVWTVVSGGEGDLHKINFTLRFCQKLGLGVLIGEPPYTSSLNIDPLRIVSKIEETEAGLYFGNMYGYRAMTAFIKDYPAILLSKPLGSDCRMLYLNPNGKVSKCPIIDNGIPVEELTMEKLRKIIYSNCTIGKCSKKVQFTPVIKISLKESYSGVEIPSDILALLDVVDQIKSLKAASASLGFAYSTYAEKIKDIEKRLGIRLIYTSKGGKDRGKTLLTAYAKQMLEVYKTIMEDLNKYMYTENGYIFYV